jgi:hypothetical protein
MKTKKFLFYLLAVLLGGCIPSLHPLYTDKELVFEEKLSGIWSNGEQIWKFEGDSEKKSYKLLTVNEDFKKGEFTAHLVKIDKMLFLDLFPKEPKLQAPAFYKFHLLRVHTFIKIEQIEPILKMRVMNPDKMKEMLENDPNLIKHEIVQRDRIVLTASTKDLQQFMKKHASVEDFFGDASDFKRLEAKDANDPNAIDPNRPDPNSTEPNES